MTEKGGIITIVKRGGRRPSEDFIRKKLHDSIVAACLSSGSPVGHAEQIGRRVSDSVIIWLESHPEVTTQDLRRVATKELRTYHPDAAYLYEHHRSIL